MQHCLDANYGKNQGKRGDSKIKACKVLVHHVLALLPFLTLTSITSRIPFSLSLSLVTAEVAEQQKIQRTHYLTQTFSRLFKVSIDNWST